MNRRGFLGAMLAAAAAPAIVKSENLMKIIVPKEKKILTLSSLAADFDGDVIGFSEWEYDIGSGVGHNWYMDEGGPRHDRAVIPSVLTMYLNESKYDPNTKLILPDIEPIKVAKVDSEIIVSPKAIPPKRGFFQMFGFG